jgi:uncharacterized protein (TIGR03435 family)
VVRGGFERFRRFKRFKRFRKRSARDAAPEPCEHRCDGTSGHSPALQEQLGVKLETGRAPVEVTVIDRHARPSEN